MKRVNTEQSLDEILSTFDPMKSDSNVRLTGGTITIWVSREDKAKYNHLQSVSNRRFGKKLRELLVAAIDKAEDKAS